MGSRHSRPAEAPIPLFTFPSDPILIRCSSTKLSFSAFFAHARTLPSLLVRLSWSHVLARLLGVLEQSPRPAPACRLFCGVQSVLPQPVGYCLSFPQLDVSWPSLLRGQQLSGRSTEAHLTGLPLNFVDYPKTIARHSEYSVGGFHSRARN